jgi:hypothetical protein
VLAAYNVTSWANFFVAEVGASAALVGLLFVAVSINLTKIIGVPGLPGRAFEALVVLIMVLFIATFGLVPDWSPTTFGAGVLAIAVTAWVATLGVQQRAPKNPVAPRHWMITRVVASQLATVPMVAGGASLLAERGGGIYWILAGVIASFLAAVLNAWVLLVEIHR